MKGKQIIVKLGITTWVAVGTVLLLFLSSENQIHRNNDFTRKYPPHPIIKVYDLDIGYNSYYIAGFQKNLLYLGNTTAPWHLLQINLENKDTSHIQLKPIDPKLNYRSIRVSVLSPYFYMMDGTMPFILQGKLGDWKARPWMIGESFFSIALPIDSNTFYIRALSAKTKKYTLGLIDKTNGLSVNLDTTLLKSQIDGIFDVDGNLLVNYDNPKLGYVYFYRNEFLVMDTHLDELKNQRTIDTVKRAQIQLTESNHGGKIQMSAPPVFVNKSAYMYNEEVLIQSDRLGRNESVHMLDQASIIDVYNYIKGTYEFSFYLYNVKNHKTREFALNNSFLVALVNDHISIYRTIEPYFSKTKKHVNNFPTGQWMGGRSKTQRIE